MKFKPVYAYLILGAVALFILVFLTNQETHLSESGNVPNDDIHKRFQNEQPPGKDNISSEFYQQMELLRQDVEKNPNDTSKLKAYADYLTAAHQYNAALPVYQQIISKDPQRTDIYFALTFIYYNQKNWEKAEDVTTQVLSYDKNNLQAKYNLGAIAASRGDNQKARNIWSDLSKNNPGTREAQLASEGLTRLDNL
jgi:tetratricopeptide (TPR) repeat protein